MAPEITFPTTLDTETNLYVVKDSAYLVLVKDYNPGDTTITVELDTQKTLLFPPTGIITLTEQCSDPQYRGLSFYYGSRTNTVFSDLTIINPELDHYKPSRVTTVVMNVMAEHHNNIKDSVIAIENFSGKKGLVGNYSTVNTGNLEERTNFLYTKAFEPKAWFSVDKRVGLAPFTVTFANQSIRLGANIPGNTIQYFWNFGDNTSSNVVYYEATSDVPSYVENVIVEDLDGGTIEKTYTRPGTYTVTLTVVNEYGTDTVEFAELINAKYEAPDQCVVEFSAVENQGVVNGVFKTPASVSVIVGIPAGINPSTSRTYSGEEVDGSGNPIDPINKYTWLLSDDTNHGNDQNTTAFYTVGGIYDVVVRCDTDSKAYRITTFPNYINVVERQNLWLSTFFGSSTTVIQTSEFGLISETFKTKQNSFTTLDITTTFLESQTNSTQLLREFKRNTSFASRSGIVSGLQGTAILHYATGRSGATISDEKIKAINYNGFLETYTAFPLAGPTYIQRPWNWVGFDFLNKVTFIFGNLPAAQSPGFSLTNLSRQIHDLLTNTLDTSTISSGDFIGGATDLLSNAADFSGGVAIYGNFSAYRYAWRNRKGYILKNNAVGTFFQIKSFFSSYEDANYSVAGFEKLPDILGPVKYEGQLVNLNSGLFFFNNTGAVSSFDTTTNVWKTGGPGLNSAEFTTLQDTTATNYDSEYNTLLASTDGDRRAYLSFDYSNNSFIKFNDLDLTFTKLPARPSGNQWNFGFF